MVNEYDISVIVEPWLQEIREEGYYAVIEDRVLTGNSPDEIIRYATDKNYRLLCEPKEIPKPINPDFPEQDIESIDRSFKEFAETAKCIGRV